MRIDFPQLILDGTSFNISCGTPNRPPVALATVDPQIACAGASCPIILDGSGSSDPDSPPGTNLNIFSYEWYSGYGTLGETYLGAGEVTSTTLALGSHSLTLVVTDSEGTIDTDTVTVVIDPAKLSLLKLKKVEIDWPKASETLAEVNRPAGRRVICRFDGDGRCQSRSLQCSKHFVPDRELPKEERE